jgi:hypothetical protein
MTGSQLRTQARIASGANSVLGAWTVISSCILGFSALEALSVWAVTLTGAVLGVAAMARALWPSDGIALSWSNFFLGGWLALSPWALSYEDNANRLWNSVLIGMAVSVLATWSITTTVIRQRRLRTAALQ